MVKDHDSKSSFESSNQFSHILFARFQVGKADIDAQSLYLSSTSIYVH